MIFQSFSYQFAKFVFHPSYYYFLLFTILLKDLIFYYSPDITAYKIVSWGSHLFFVAWGTLRTLFMYKKFNLNLEIALLLVFAFVSLIASDLSIRSIIWTITFLLLSVSIPLEFKHGRLNFHFYRILTIIVFSCLMLTIINLALLFDGFTFEYETLYKRIGFFQNRFWGITGNPNRDGIIYSILLSFLFPIFIYYILKEKPSWVKLVNTILAINLGSVMLIFSYSRTSLIVTITSLSLHLLTPLRSNKVKFKQRVNISFFTILTGVLIASSISFSKNFLPEKQLNRSLVGSGSNGRIALWGNCINSYMRSSLEFKIIGGGIENIQLSCNWYSSKKISNNNAHNFILQALIGTGIIGALISIYLFCKTLNICLSQYQHLFRKRIESRNDYLLVTSTVLTFTAMIHGLLDVGAMFSINSISLVFWLCRSYITSPPVVQMDNLEGNPCGDILFLGRSLYSK